MKKFLYSVGLALLAATFSACQDDIDAPGIDIPEASIEPNTTIKELKETFWSDKTNYIDTIGTKPDGQHYIIAGRVVSSDEEGNVFKNLSIQDETAAITVSINSYNLYLRYRIGQEVVVDLTGMYIGKYSGLMQLGMPDVYQDGYQASFMAPEFFQVHAQLNGMPQPEKIDTLVLDSFDELVSNQESFIKLQSRIVRFNNVKFANGGTGATFSTYHENGNQNLIDANGNGESTTILTVRTSGYSNFWNKTVPADYGDVVGILSYYQSGTSGNWQLILNDYDGIQNFGNPTLPQGSRENPYTVGQVVGFENAGTAKSGWMTGYIVGAVAPGLTEVTSDEDIEWSQNVTLNNTLVIAPEASTKDYTKCVVIELPQGSTLRSLGNLRDNPDNYGKQIWLNGTFANVLGMAGITGNNGATSQWEIEGVDSSAATNYKGDFNSFNDGEPKANPYGTYTNATGWTATNCILLAGQESGVADANPRFAFIGDASTIAPTLNGKASAPGKITSPTLTGGIKTLSFCYGFAFTDTQCQFTVNIYQNGAVAATKTVTVSTVTKGVANEFTMACNLSGSFTIEITNDHIGGLESNKERLSIWNLTWTN